METKIKMRTIAGLRKDAGELSVEKMAKDFGVTTDTIYNWQKNQMNLPGKRVKEICEYFGITSDEFLGLK